MSYDGKVAIHISTGCFCNIFHCEHQFRAWSRAWLEGARRRMPLVLNHPYLMFRVTA